MGIKVASGKQREEVGQGGAWPGSEPTGSPGEAREPVQENRTKAKVISWEKPPRPQRGHTDGHQMEKPGDHPEETDI